MEPVKHCLGFAIDCGTIAKGAGVVIMAAILFIGSIYLLLTSIFGRWMGYLVLVVAFSGWMMILSSLWLFGFWSQGLTTLPNLGPRGSQPAWVVLEASPSQTSDKYQGFSTYPGPNWKEADLNDKEQVADETEAESAVGTFLATQLNIEEDLLPTDPTAFTPTQFTIDGVRFTEDGDTKLGVAKAHFSGGGPLWTVSMYFDSGSIPRYSYMFLAVSILLFAIHVPLLDRAEKKRKGFLTGGSAPAWYGPA
jgi:hypothetical protein